MKVGIIGLGAMGSRIAKNIVEDGFETYVFNRSAEKAKDLGANICQSPKELVAKSDVIFSVVSNDQASEQVWNHPENGGALSLTEDKVILELSTLSERQSQEHLKNFKKNQFLLAPIVGSRPQAEARELVFLVGGKKESYEKVKPIIESLSAKVVHFENSLQACQLKLTINSLFAIQTIAFAEFYHGLSQGGFTKEQIHMILPNLPVTSPIMQMMLGLFHDEKFAPLFPIELVEKDLGYACQFLKQNNVDSFITTATRDVFQTAIKNQLGDQNISGIFNLYNKGERNE